ncbi:YheC/YheD family endospore coat-associated protein [Bacillus sp. Au-Bac7]|uniref:YheC/YheD family endospore coat-associated protein n=1 Tax=Bacillus sp. Au-Bac7 TaxID=2906458 RepID=UPI001E304024|nr:YheC/YheD family protein [Bacillus sp. Au-Bac7]MCE4051081.1 YheC/YheD family protein [Bacillus sp. Au-Bac7]
MSSFGIMSLSLENEKSYITEIAKLGKSLAFDVYHFVPSSYNPLTEKVSGKIFDSEQNCWLTQDFPVPSFLYDRCYYQENSHSRQCKNIVEWLKQKKDIVFIGNGLPNKLKLYDVLKASKLAPYIPKSKQVISADELLEDLRFVNPIILKPINGSQGNGIYFIKEQHKRIFVRTDKKERHVEHIFKDKEKFSRWLTTLLQKNDYFSQSYLPLCNQDKQPFDIRALLQKNGQNKWEIIEKGIRLGAKDRIISNLSAGAEVIPFKQWLDTAPYKMKSFIENEINDILSSLPPILEQSFPALFELGVDIGITENGSLWILDVNSKPGRKVILLAYPDLSERLYKAPLAYAAMLRDGQRRNSNEKTLLY